MDAYTCIRSKRDTRAYEDRAIAPQSLHRVLQAGRMAGSSKNSQPCRFVVLEERGAKERLAACGHFAGHITSAPVVIAIVVPGPGHDFDVGRCAQNMMLAAWSEGIASCPVSMHDAECARRVLGLPEGHRVAIAIALGHPGAGRSRDKRRRTPLEELVHPGGWR